MKFGKIKWHIEYTITILITLTIVLLMLPTSIKSTFQANLIAKWKDCYKRLDYAHDAILKQEKSEILTSFRRANTQDERKRLFLNIIKPYFLYEAQTQKK